MDTGIQKSTTEIVPVNNINILSEFLNDKIQPESFEEYVSIGLAAREIKDMTNWVIGKAALELTEKYGRGSLKEFCKMIGYGGQENSVEVYRWTAEKFINKYGKLPVNQDGARLSFSFYKVVANTEDPESWLEEAEEKSLTINQLKNALKGNPTPDVCSHQNTKQITICVDCGVRINK